MKFKHLKPYLYISLFAIIPLLLLPTLKRWYSDSDYKIIKEESEIKQKSTPVAEVQTKSDKFGLVIHGGAGNFTNANISPDLEIEYKTQLLKALQVGIKSLNNGDSAVAVVEQVILVLEDSPLFNAGKSSVFTDDDISQMDASIMNGKTMDAGAVSGVSTVKNPISAAVKVMTNSNYIMLSGERANQFAKKQHLDIVTPSYFHTKKQINKLQASEKQNKNNFGVGCVVLDKFGNIAAGSSTGGINNKQYSQIDNSSIIGAGTYANNKTCAISATGQSEFFIRYNIAHDISSRMEYLNETLKKSSSSVIAKLKKLNASGGVIGIDRKGNICMEFNTTGMFRAYYIDGMEPKVYLYKNK